MKTTSLSTLLLSSLLLFSQAPSFANEELEETVNVVKNESFWAHKKAIIAASFGVLAGACAWRGHNGSSSNNASSPTQRAFSPRDPRSLGNPGTPPTHSPRHEFSPSFPGSKSASALTPTDANRLQLVSDQRTSAERNLEEGELAEFLRDFDNNPHLSDGPVQELGFLLTPSEDENILRLPSGTTPTHVLERSSSLYFPVDGSTSSSSSSFILGNRSSESDSKEELSPLPIHSSSSHSSPASAQDSKEHVPAAALSAGSSPSSSSSVSSARTWAARVGSYTPTSALETSSSSSSSSASTTISRLSSLPAQSFSEEDFPPLAASSSSSSHAAPSAQSRPARRKSTVQDPLVNPNSLVSQLSSSTNEPLVRELPEGEGPFFKERQKSLRQALDEDLCQNKDMALKKYVQLTQELLKHNNGAGQITLYGPAACNFWDFYRQVHTFYPNEAASQSSESLSIKIPEDKIRQYEKLLRGLNPNILNVTVRLETDQYNNPLLIVSQHCAKPLDPTIKSLVKQFLNEMRKKDLIPLHTKKKLFFMFNDKGIKTVQEIINECMNNYSKRSIEEIPQSVIKAKEALEKAVASYGRLTHLRTGNETIIDLRDTKIKAFYKDSADNAPFPGASD